MKRSKVLERFFLILSIKLTIIQVLQDFPDSFLNTVMIKSYFSKIAILHS